MLWACARLDSAAAPPRNHAARAEAPGLASAERSSGGGTSGSVRSMIRPPESKSAAPLSDTPQAAAPEVYAYGRTHSPLSAGTVQRLLRLLARNTEGQPDVFAKVGDSVTASPHALGCFARGPDELGEHVALKGLIERFRTGDAGGSNPFARTSRAARSGWSAWQVLAAGAPLSTEIAEIAPRYALVQFGTNDVQIGSLHHFADRLWEIVELLHDRGVIPILFTIMPRYDPGEAPRRVPWYNAAIRAVATAHRTPLIDLHGALSKLPGGGLSSDGIHPSVYRDARGPDACALTAAGLGYGFNVRNLLALEALDRVTRVLASEAALDEPSVLAGSGSAADPFVVPSLPLVSARSAPARDADTISHYRGCKTRRPTPGGEHWYRLDLPRSSTVRAIGFDRGGADLDLVLLDRHADPKRCLAAGQRMLLTHLAAGTYHLVIDAAEAGGGAVAANYAVALLDR
jgi:hypothetical protein